ncbi:MBL fold metallo-hydrolase [Lactovum odontotermitis]
MPVTGQKITDIKIYYCGYCTNQLRHIVKNWKSEKRQFPAAAVFFRHEGKAYLFDTGYSSRIFKNGWKSWIYQKLNPVSFEEEDKLVNQLAEDGIKPSEINGIFLSHLHPDHIAGLCDFPACPIILSSGSWKTLQAPKLLDLIFVNLLPEDFQKRVQIVELENRVDFFGDGSLLLLDLTGHTDGQIGMFFPEYQTLYGADFCWGMDLLPLKMKLIARFFQKDYPSYQRTIEHVKEMQSAGVKVIVNHDKRSY